MPGRSFLLVIPLDGSILSNGASIDGYIYGTMAQCRSRHTKKPVGIAVCVLIMLQFFGFVLICNIQWMLVSTSSINSGTDNM